jgi:hypothetical protein
MLHSERGAKERRAAPIREADQNETKKELRMRKFIMAATAVAALAVPAVSMADAPNGTFVNNTNEQSQGSQLGVQSSQIEQNGQWVKAWFHTDRGEVVQSILHP